MSEEFDQDGIKRNWPGYEVIETLGQGAYGKVYKIKREHLGSTLFSAVKVVHIPKNEDVTYTLKSEGMTQDEIAEYYEKQMQQFLKENQLLEALKGSTNIVTIEDCVAEKNEKGMGYTIYIKMELLESFENLLKTYEVGPEMIAKVGTDICNALIDCEQKHIVHRDIKPANVFVNEFGTFKLGDFGVAREMEHSQTNMTQVGTGLYMAPELFREGKSDNRVDIYSLGIMLYRLGNKGKFPFVESGTTNPNDRQEALLKRLKGETLPFPDNVDRELGRIILKACAHDPDNRYSSASELKYDLQKWEAWKQFGEDMILESAEDEKTTQVDQPIFVQKSWQETSQQNSMTNTPPVNNAAYDNYYQQPANTNWSGNGYAQQPVSNNGYGNGYVQQPVYGNGYAQQPASNDWYGNGYVQQPASNDWYGNEYAQQPANNYWYGNGYPPQQVNGNWYQQPVQGNMIEQGMKWYKFLIYFGLFASSLMCLGSAGSYLFLGSGIIFGDYIGAIYEYLPSLKIVDFLFGIWELCVAVIYIVVRQKLAHYKKDAIAWYIGTEIIDLIVTMIVVIRYIMILPEEWKMLIVDSFGFGIVLSSIMILLNIIYFNKRRHLFVN